MACALTTSIPLDCKDSVGGIKEIKVKNWSSLSTIAADFTVTSGVVTIGSPSRTGWYTWGIEKETASFSDTPTISVQNGTSFYAQEVKVIFNKFSAAIRNEIQLYAKSRVLISVRDFNDNYWLFGMDYGMDLTTGTTSSGTARGDRNGSELTFTGKESQSVLNMSSSTYATLITA